MFPRSIERTNARDAAHSIEIEKVEQNETKFY